MIRRDRFNSGALPDAGQQPVARLLPIDVESDRLIGSLRHKLDVRGDLLSTGVTWKANAEP